MPEGNDIIWLMALGLYFLPGLIASGRKHANRNAIGVVNLFLGWTLIGWIVALAWSLTANVETRAPRITERRPRDEPVPEWERREH